MKATVRGNNSVPVIEKVRCIVCGRRCDRVNAWKFCAGSQADSEAEIKEYKEKLGALYETDRRGYQAMMADKNMQLLFMVDSDGDREYEHETRRISINTENGMPYIQRIHYNDVVVRQCTVSAGIPIVISYHVVHYWAWIKSEETYNKYNGISKENWIDFV